MTIAKWIRAILCFATGQCAARDYPVRWRREENIDGVKWKKIYCPYEEKDDE